MQYNSDKQDNNYSSEGVYPSYQGTSLPYPQQSGYAVSSNAYSSQTPLHQQKGIVIVPVYRPLWNNKIATPLTTNLRIFLAISGFIYALWGISAVSVQIGILVNSFSTYYHGFWLSIFSIIGGIMMMIVAFRSSYPLFQLTRIYAINLVFCGVGLIFSVINYTTSPRCMSTSSWYCDDSLSNNLKLMLLIIFILGLIHTIINMIVVSKEHKRALAKFNPNVIDH